MQTPDEMMALTIKAFKEWRETRQYSVSKTPKRLQQQVVALLVHFSSSKVMSALNISGTNIKRWSKHNQDKHDPAEFVTLPSIDEPSPHAQLSMELAFNNGCCMRFYGAISPAQLTALTQSVDTSSRTAS